MFTDREHGWCVPVFTVELLLPLASAASGTPPRRRRSHDIAGACTCHVEARLLQRSTRRRPAVNTRATAACQNAAECLVHQLDVRDHVTPSLMVLHWLPIRCRIDFKLCMIMYGIHTLADARRISKTSSVRPAAQQHVLACDRLPAASM